VLDIKARISAGIELFFLNQKIQKKSFHCRFIGLAIAEKQKGFES